MADIGDRRGAARRRLQPDEAVVERVLQRLGKLTEFTDAQVRQIATIALAAASADETNRRRRDESARDDRRRSRALGRD